MPSEPVTSKAQMYRLLAAGAFGNTVPQWLDADAWTAEAPKSILWWGVRTLTPGGPCRLNCPAAEVPATFAEFERAGHPSQISMMVDRVATVTAWFEVWDAPTGLVVEGIEYPQTPDWTWRNSMPDPAKRRRWEGTAARLVLAKHLNVNSRDDLADVLDQYPDHVVELSALDRPLGLFPHRNGIVWEVRLY